jgi:hypothetical protein
MTITVLPTSDLESVVLGYLLNALDVNDTYACALEGALPDATIYVEERGAVLAATIAPPPVFRDAVATLAEEQRYDVVLVRVASLDEDAVRSTVDLSLGLLPGAKPWAMNDLEPWASRDGQLWLVPAGFGPAVSVSYEGVILELVPPYQTLAQRTAGVLRAAGELASLLPVITAEVRW